MTRNQLSLFCIILLVLSSCSYFQNSGEKSIVVGPDTRTCIAGMSETQCLQIKWTKDQTEWENFFGQIEGFNFEKGYEYELVVLEEKVENPPADVSSLRYKLVKEVSKRKVEMAETNFADNSNNALDWAGTYEGILPCADCAGIKTSITLFADGTFQKNTEYLGKNGKPFSETGKFEWNKEGNIIALIVSNENQQYLVGENQLFHLDNEGNQIKGNLAEKYILTKTNNSTAENNKGFEDKKWLLVSFLGKDVKENNAEYFIIFNSKEKRLSTKAGCNIMNAGYELSNELNLKINTIMSTKMACPENSIEDEYVSNLETVNNITTNGELLNLNRARMTIATFKLQK